jgi:DHA1 family tetracycline resistance protein-like MFS transporter
MSNNKKQAALGFIFITIFIDVMGFGVIAPVVPKLLILLLKGPQAVENTAAVSQYVSEVANEGKWLTITYAVMQFIFAPILGNLSDKYGRRKVLLFSLLGFGIDYFITGFATSFAWLFVGRMIAGITGASFATASAYIADVSPPEKRAQNFGMIGVAFGVGFIVGPALGGYLSGFGLRVPFFAAAGLALLNWIYGLLVLPESLPKDKRRPFNWKKANAFSSLKQLRKYPVIEGLIISIFLIYISAHAVQSVWSYYTIYKFKWTEPQVGASLSFVGLLVGLIQGGLIRIVIPKFGKEKCVYFGLAFYAIGFTLFAFATQSWMMYAFLVPYALGGIAGPSIQGIISNHVPPNEQGELQGALTSLMSVATIIGPLIMLQTFHYFSSKTAFFYFPGAPMLVAATLTLISAWLAYRTLVSEKK